MTVKNNPVRQRAMVNVNTMPAQNLPVEVTSLVDELLMSKVLVAREVAGSPLNAAPRTWLLFDRHSVAGQDSTDGRSQRCSIDGFIVSGSAVVELASIYQPSFLVEQEKVWGAYRTIGFGDVLRFVVAEGEIELQRFGHCFELFGGIIRVVSRIVAADGHDPNAFRHIVFSDFREGFTDVHNVGAVVTNEHDKKSGLF